MTRPNIVPLAANSFESREKARNWARAAHRLGLAVRRHPDRHTVAILPCSDSRLRDAAWLARNHGIPGVDPVAASVVSSKALPYGVLPSQGFDLRLSLS